MKKLTYPSGSPSAKEGWRQVTRGKIRSGDMCFFGIRGIGWIKLAHAIGEPVQLVDLVFRRRSTPAVDAEGRREGK